MEMKKSLGKPNTAKISSPLEILGDGKDGYIVDDELSDN